MSHITIYLNTELARKMRVAAENEGLSQSRWIARLVEEKLESEWPESVRKLAGAWPDFPEAEKLRENQSADLVCEKL